MDYKLANISHLEKYAFLPIDSCVIRVDDTAEVAGDVLEEVTGTGDFKKGQ